MLTVELLLFSQCSEVSRHEARGKPAHIIYSKVFKIIRKQKTGTSDKLQHTQYK